MGCAPIPKNNDKIPKINSEPIRKDITSIEELTHLEEVKATQLKF